MCMQRSKKHGLLQGCLVFLLVLCLFLFASIVFIHLGVYLLTESNDLLDREQRHVPDRAALLQSKNETSSHQHDQLFDQQRRRRDIDAQSSSSEDSISAIFFTRKCPMNQWIVHSAILLESCPSHSLDSIDSMSDDQFTSCLNFPSIDRSLP
ncbi:hypothetical protein QR98_0094190 [Sarcoptes scabiei]|uniref:Uncharacterized protein n=1 Tax=Sarcoptes scabiei TaxID=52283 RepID=A0A132AJW3_SARSC|nr:hypothetical protein QR98_0094190 [Sarcoptes scabiei]